MVTAHADATTLRPGWSRPCGRVHGFDALRGLAVVSMVLFHGCYDLVYLRGQALGWFSPPFVDLWRASISWTFLLVSGMMCSFSANNLKRSLRYLAVAAAIFAATSLAAVDDPISFGIVFCIGASTLADALLERVHAEPRGIAAALSLFCLFILLQGLPEGRAGLPGLELCLPTALYGTPWLAWLGFPGPGFVSGDYYPLLPYGLLYGAGIALGRWFSTHGYPDAFLKARCRPLELVGRHALLVYLVHQPLLLLLLGCL